MVAAVGDRDREVAQDHAGIVGGAALAGRCHRLRERRRQSQPIGQLHQEKAPAWETRPSPSALTSTVWRVVCVFTFRVSSWVWEWVVANRILRTQEDAPGWLPQVLIGGSGLGVPKSISKLPLRAVCQVSQTMVDRQHSVLASPDPCTS